MGRLIAGILCLLIFLPARGQEKLSFAEFNQSTYALYEQHQWKELIKTGEKGLRQGIDFYYLRMRLGIAAYNLKNYTKAIRHFRKALSFSHRDPNALEYLYYCYLFLGRDLERSALAKELPAAVKKRITPEKPQAISSLEISAQYLSNEKKVQQTPVNEATGSSGTSWRTLMDQGIEGAALVGWNIGHATRLYTGYRYLLLNRSLYLSEDLQSQDYTENIFNQHTLFTALQIRPFSNAVLNLSMGYQQLRPRYAATNRWGQTFLGVFPENDFSGHLSLQFQLPYFSLMAGGGISNMNGYFQQQQEIQAIVYPLGNLNLYLLANLVRVKQESTDPGFSQSLFGTLMLGAKIMKPLWIEVYAGPGDRYNVQLKEGWESYNEFNPVSDILGGDLLISIPRHKLILNAGFYSSTITSYYFYTDQDVLFRNEPIVLNMLNFYGGIKWTF